MRSDANSSEGVTASKQVRRTPCPEGMSVPDFVEVRVVFCISVYANVSACADNCMHLSTAHVNTHTNCRVHNTHTHTHRYKQNGPPCVCGSAKSSSRNILLAKLYPSRWARTHRLGLPRITYSTVITFETVGNMLLIHDNCDIDKGPCMQIMYSYTRQQEWSVSTTVDALTIPHPHQALLGFMTKEGVQQLKVRV